MRVARFAIAIFSFFAVAVASGAEAEIKLFPMYLPTTYGNLEELISKNVFAKIGADGKTVVYGGRLETDLEIKGSLPPFKAIKSVGEFDYYTGEWKTSIVKITYGGYVLSTINSATPGFSVLVRLHMATIAALTNAQVELLKSGAEGEAGIYFNSVPL